MRAGTCGASLAIVMASWLRTIIWIAVVVLPGGLLLLPVLLVDARRRRLMQERASNAV